MKTNTKPLISVVMPVFNAEKYLQAAVESILSQSYKNLELIAVDDGSSDGSLKVLKSLAKTDKRLKVFKNSKNRNIVFTLNRGMSLAKGQYIARMDADDIAVKDRLKTQLHYLLKHPNTVVVGSNCFTIDQDNNFIGYKRFPISDAGIKAMLFLINPMQHPTMLINRSLLPGDFTWYNRSLTHAEDLDLLFRLAKIGYVHNLKKPLLYYRLHLNSKTFKSPRENYEETKVIRQIAMSQYGYQKPFYLRFVNRLQELMIVILPTRLVYLIYNLLRDLSYFLSAWQTNKKQKHQAELDSLIPSLSISR